MTVTLKQHERPAASRIVAVGAYRPANLVPNEDLIGPIDSSDEWIRQRTGIVTRQRATAEETVPVMAVGAAREALERAGLVARERQGSSIWVRRTSIGDGLVELLGRGLALLGLRTERSEHPHRPFEHR